jgi:hypothetical protein
VNESAIRASAGGARRIGERLDDVAGREIA